MPSAREIKAGAAYVELFLHDNRFTRGLKLAEKRLKRFGGSVGSIGKRMFLFGAGIAGSLFAAAKGFASMGDELDKMSSRVGASVEFLSALGYAAEIGGTDIEAMETGIRRMQKTAYDASTGLATAKEAFDELGISVQDSGGQLKSTETLFMESAAALSKMENNTRKSALAQIVFGKAGTKLLPMLKDGADGLVEMMEEAKRLGLVMSTEDATAAAVFTDQMTKLSHGLKMVVFRIGAAVAGEFGKFTDWLTDGAKRLAEFIDKNKGLIVSILKIAAVVAAAGAALVVLGTLIGSVGTIFGTIAAVISGFGTAVGVVISVVGALLSPLGLLAAAAIALGAYFLKSSGQAGAAMGWLGEKFRELWDTAKKAFKGISDALAAGDFKLAGQILWLTLKVEWAKGVNALQEIWTGFKIIFMDTWTNAVYGVAKLWTNALAIMEEAWVYWTNVLAAKWDWAEKHIAKGIGWVIAKVQGLEPAEVLGDIERQYAGKAKEREKRTQGRLAGIEAKREGELAALEETQEQKNRQRRESYAQQLEARSKELQDLKRQRDEAIAQAAKAASAPTGKLVGGDLGELLAAGGAAGAAAVQAAAPAAKGTFSAFAAARMGGNTLAQRTAKAGEETAKNTRKLEERSRTGGINVTS